MRVIIAGTREAELAKTAYPAFVTAGFEISALTQDAQEVIDLAQSMDQNMVLVVEADLWPTPEEAATALSALSLPVVVILPVWWGGNKDLFEDWVVAGFVAPVAWPRVVRDLTSRVGGARKAQRADGQGDATPDPKPVARPSEPAQSPPTASGKRVVALWSGPAGGTGRTTLALALAMLGAERGLDVGLLALSEPAVSAYLKLPRSPNVTAFLCEGRAISAVEQRVTWQIPDGGPAQLHVLLGPARPRDGVVDAGTVGAAVQAARSAHDLVVLDLPPLTPGGNAWSLAPLKQATDVVLVCPPTAAGVVAVVEALVTLRDVGVAGTISLAMNRRSPGAPVSSSDFRAGVENLWGHVPAIAADLRFCAGLPRSTEAGAPMDAEGIGEAVAALAETTAGIPGLTVHEKQGQTNAELGDGRARKRTPRRLPRLGELISVEVTE
jgi:Mrp family chromosome partitioning ATPase